MFLAFYILHQSTFAIIKSMLEKSTESFTFSLQQQNESFAQALKQVTDWADRVAAQQATEDNRLFEAMKDQLEALQVLMATVGRIEQKVDNIKEGLCVKS